MYSEERASACRLNRLPCEIAAQDYSRATGYPEVIHTDEKALAIPIFRNPTFSGLRYRRSYWSGR